MICPDCIKGYVLRRSFPGNEVFPYPCETCGGSGVAFCCDAAGACGQGPVDCAVEQIVVSPEEYDAIVAMINMPAQPTKALMDLLRKPAPWDGRDVE